MSFNIKKSFADCSTCPLLDSKSCIMESNCKKDLSKVDIIFIAENPGKDEVESGIPLIGKAGKLFRTYFNKYQLDLQNYLLTNCVLCQTLNQDGTTGNPTNEVIDRCKVNSFEIIKSCNPKLIVLMGQSPVKAFGISETGITKIRGNVFEWNGYNILVTVHPSYVNRNRSYEIKFEEDIKKAKNILLEKHVVESYNTDIKVKDSGAYYYKIPDKFYDNHRLVDVQYLERQNKVLYIFRDENNKKVYHKEDNEYIAYKLKEGRESTKIVEYDDLEQVSIPWRERSRLDPTNTYEGDVNITVKHAQDYFLQTKNDIPVSSLNVFFLDIETFTEDRAFPKASEAKSPICMITYGYNGLLKSLILDPKVFNIEKKIEDKVLDGSEIVQFTDEKVLLRAFLSDVKKLDPDIITGWNVINFDMFYVYNRCKNFGIDPNAMTKFGGIFIDGERDFAIIPGMIVLDQLVLYKSFTFTKKENYKLGTIAQLELGSTKLDSGSHFSEMFRNDPVKALKYNIRDVTLLIDLEKKLKHIKLQNELKIICKSSFRSSSSPFGQLDSLVVSFLKERGWSCKNADIHSSKKSFKGAFVKEPLVGIHNHIVDLDYTSLYPSIIITYNIGVDTFAMQFKDPNHGYKWIYENNKFPENFKMIIDPANKAKEMTITKEQLQEKIKEFDLIYTVTGSFFKSHKTKISFFNEICTMLLGTRKKYKGLMNDAIENKDETKEGFYNIRQLVYKVLANALYGVLGNAAFRFFNKDCARTITVSGQEVCKTAILEGNAYIEKLKTGKYEKPPMITNKEMFDKTLNRETPHIITGDTDSLFACYENIIEPGIMTVDILDKIEDWNHQLEDFLNNEIIKTIPLTHNVPKEWNRLYLKNELIISRGLFQSKKHYAIHVVKKEGKDYDKIIPMGIDVKRSDFPSYTKECLSELLEMILKTKVISLIDLQNYVNGKKQEFINRIKAGDKTVARPIGWNKKIKEYKKLPQGVTSMQNWNNLMYEIHSYNTRAYMFKIKGIDYTKAPEDVIQKFDKEFLQKGKKIETIALPDEEANLPEWFIPDVKAMLKFSWEDRYNLLLDSIMKVKEIDSILKF